MRCSPRTSPKKASSRSTAGVPVRLEIVALDPGVRLEIGETTLEEVGDSVLLGTTPEVDAEGEWQVVVPEQVSSGDFTLSFVLTDDAATYEASEPVTVVLTLAAGPGPGARDEETPAPFATGHPLPVPSLPSGG